MFDQAAKGGPMMSILLRAQAATSVSIIAGVGSRWAGINSTYTGDDISNTMVSKSWPLRVFDLPFESPNPEIRLYWHGRRMRDPAHMWLRQQVMELCKPFDLLV